MIEEFQARYDNIKASKNPSAKLVAGTAEDRLSGLERLLEKARGTTVLDISSHNGTIAKAFAAAGASVIDGVDFWPPGVEQARAALKGGATRARFAECDLRGGISAVRSALAPMPARYDTVLYLGIHQHLGRQMEAGQFGATGSRPVPHGIEIFRHKNRRYVF